MTEYGAEFALAPTVLTALTMNRYVSPCEDSPLTVYVLTVDEVVARLMYKFTESPWFQSI